MFVACLLSELFSNIAVWASCHVLHLIMCYYIIHELRQIYVRWL